MSDTMHLVGLDLGQAQDFSALAVLERRALPAGGNSYACRHLVRWPLGTAYTRIVSDVLALTKSPRLTDPVLVVDQTGVGRPVVDLFRREVACGFKAVTITSGESASRGPDGSLRVPKNDLVGVLKVLFGQQRLKVAPSLREAAALVRELENFRVKVTASANETYGPWREGQNDDLVLAVALAAWVGERTWVGRWEPTSHPAARSVFADAPPGVFGT